MLRSKLLIRPLSPSMRSLQTAIETLLHAYAAIFFLQRAWVGGLILVASCFYLNVGVCGLLAAITAQCFSHLLNFTIKQSSLPITNAILVGLSLGAAYQVSYFLMLLVVLGSCLATLLTVILSDYLWRLDRLPVLSLSFVMAAIATAFAGQTFHTLTKYMALSIPVTTAWPEQINSFCIAMGSTLFLPNPIVGLCLFIGLLLSSRYQAFLALTGFLVGQYVYDLLSGSPYGSLSSWIGFNFILSALAVGGIFTLPNKASLLLAWFAAALSALITLALQSMMMVYGLPVMALPFLLTTLLILTALSKRPYAQDLKLLLHSPALPEENLRRERIAKAQGHLLTSTPLYLPYLGEWQIYQGFDGEHTHQGIWRYAVDFYQILQGKSFRNAGTELSDYYCFGLPVLSPGAGYVVACINHVLDNQPGDVNTRDNWGNYVIIRLHNYQYVVLAHLQQYSVQVEVGQYVTAKQTLGLCGNSGRSPQPHLHMHIQQTAYFGSESYPFHFVTCVRQEEAQATYHAFCEPKQDDRLLQPAVEHDLRNMLRFQVGQYFDLNYQLSKSSPWLSRRFTVKLSLNGEFRLHSDTEAHVGFYYSDTALHFYDRQGPQDSVLDAWILALSTSPFCQGSLHWHDQQPLDIFPTSLWQDMALLLCKPMGGMLSSQFQRYSLPHQDHNRWLQCAEHHLHFALGYQTHCQTRAYLDKNAGCQHVELIWASGTQLTILVQQMGIIADKGIPAIDFVSHSTDTCEGELA